MKNTVPITELEKMSPSEVERDLRTKRAEAANMRLGLEMQKEKNHAGYRVLKREIARMTMVLDRVRKAKTPVVAAKTASKVEKNPVKDAGSAKVVTAKSPSRTKKAK